MASQEAQLGRQILLEMLVMVDLALPPDEIARNLKQDREIILERMEQLRKCGLVEVIGPTCFQATPEGESKALTRSPGLVNA